MIVIDASAVAGIVRDGGESPAADFLAERADKIIAPGFFAIEVAQVAWKYAHAGMLDNAGAEAMMRAMLACVDELRDDGELVAEAFSEALRTDHSIYDMLYFVLARRTSSLLLTCDRRLAELCDQHGVDCVQLIDL